MNNQKEKQALIGSFYTKALALTDKRGGKQKLQKIIGKNLFDLSPNKKTWLFDNEKIQNLTSKKISDFIKKIELA